jgi:hypothetical protein
MRKQISFIILCCTLLVMTSNVYSVDNLSPIPTSRSIPGYITPGPNEVFIDQACIEMPLNKIVIIKYKGKHCAMKFKRFWHEKDEKGKFSTYASYDIYYQKDGSGDFSKGNVKYSEELASFLPLNGGHYFARQRGKPMIQCGSLDIGWGYQGFLCFFPYGKQRGGYGIEIAPTPWESFSEVDIHHPNIKWLKYDKSRKRKTISIKKFWDSK